MVECVVRRLWGLTWVLAVTAESYSMFQSLIFLICKMKLECLFYRDEIYPRYIRHPFIGIQQMLVPLSSLFRGILSVSWSQADAELLLSSAKDNQILCWNLGSSEVGWPSYGPAGKGDERVEESRLQLCVLGCLT